MRVALQRKTLGEMKLTCVYRLFSLLWISLFAVMIGTTAFTDEPSPLFLVLGGGLLITFGGYVVRHKQEAAPAQIFWLHALNTPGYLGFMGIMAILMGTILIIAGQ